MMKRSELKYKLMRLKLELEDSIDFYDTQYGKAEVIEDEWGQGYYEGLRDKAYTLKTEIERILEGLE